MGPRIDEQIFQRTLRPLWRIEPQKIIHESGIWRNGKTVGVRRKTRHQGNATDHACIAFLPSVSNVHFQPDSLLKLPLRPMRRAADAYRFRTLGSIRKLTRSHWKELLQGRGTVELFL